MVNYNSAIQDVLCKGNPFPAGGSFNACTSKWRERIASHQKKPAAVQYAPKHPAAPGAVQKIDGVGVDLSRFAPVPAQEKAWLREEYGYPQDAFLLIYIAEFIPRKNHAFLLEVFRTIYQEFPQAKLLLAGKGELLETCRQQAAALGLGEAVDFLGYRRDIPQLCQLSDILVAVSKQEGLPINVVEGMACGLPVVCSEIRGQVDLVQHRENGLLYPPGDADAFYQAIRQLAQDEALRHTWGAEAVKRAERFSVGRAMQRMAGIYRSCMEFENRRKPTT